MKNFSFIVLLILLFSCGKKVSQERLVTEEDSSIPPYDTVAIDSFSNGATSVDVVRKIRMASQQFQDSLKKVKLKNEEEKILQKSKDDQLKAEKKAEENKKKAEASKDKNALKSGEEKKETSVTP